MTTGGAVVSAPARRANMLPMASTRTSSAASRHPRAKRSRPSRSSAVSVTRRTPPFGVAPILASSMSERHRRSPSTFGFDMPPILEAALEQDTDAGVGARIAEADHAVELELPFGRHALG